MRRAAATACGFLAVIVYPAIPLGHTSGVAFVDLVGVLALGLLVLRGGRPTGLGVFALLLLPLWISAAASTLGGWAIDPGIGAKSVVTLAMAMACVAIPDLLEDRAMLLAFLDGLAVGVFLHAAVALVQLDDFARGRLSFLWLYETNPGLPFNEAAALDYVRYIQRPWGLFPEPSAMAASLGPMLALLLETGLSRLTGKARRALHLGAAVCGVSLVLASRSGYAVFLAAAVGALLVGRMFQARLQRGALLALGTSLLLAVAGALLVGLAVSVLGDRTHLSQNGSWTMRWASLGASLRVLASSPSALVFGAGAGQSFLWLQQSGIAAATGITAIWSVLLTYVSETGVIGLFALGLVFARVFRALGRSGRVLPGWVMLGTWACAVGFTTSYPSLPLLWISLGVVLSWDRFFARAPAAVTPLQLAPSGAGGRVLPAGK